MTPPLSRDLRSPCGLPAARLSGKPKQKDSENGKALKNRGLRGSKRIYRNFVAVLAQGPQGKIGADGAQGVQGKIGLTGDTGAQGPQGKIGVDGVQGVQGKIGPKGDPGDSAPLQTTVFLALATDQTIGTTGKYIGLGSQAGSHDQVSIVVPAGAGATVTTFVAKVSQGNTARFGDAELYQDGPTDNGTLIGTCALDPDPDDAVTRCMMMLTAVLVEKDSLSCFIRTDGGSFEGGSCSVLIDLGTADP